MAGAVAKAKRPAEFSGVLWAASRVGISLSERVPYRHHQCLRPEVDVRSANRAGGIGLEVGGHARDRIRHDDTPSRRRLVLQACRADYFEKNLALRS